MLKTGNRKSYSTCPKFPKKSAAHTDPQPPLIVKRSAWCRGDSSQHPCQCSFWLRMERTIEAVVCDHGGLVESDVCREWLPDPGRPPEGILDVLDVDVACNKEPQSALAAAEGPVHG